MNGGHAEEREPGEGKPTERRRVAVLRVDLRGDHFTVVLLEVGRHAQEDRLLGTATTSEGVCEILQHWLHAVTSV